MSLHSFDPNKLVHIYVYLQVNKENKVSRVTLVDQESPAIPVHQDQME